MNNFNDDVLKDLKDIENQIKEEKENPEADAEKLLKLRLKKLYRGMELNSGFGNNIRRGIPY